MLNKKKSIIFFISVYISSYFLNSFFFVNFGKINAENPLESTNIITILVDKNIYDNIKNEIQRYTTDYIQKEISNSKAVVLPIDINNYKAKDITKILENIYFEGLKDETSKLIGLIIIGDIPLPVVKNEGFIYPSIYPYVDFEKQKFIRSDLEKYFIYNDNPKGEAEIWHSIINFKENINEYQDFFEKLKKYYDNPSDFVDSKIWYDDIVANKKYFYQEALGSYINNFIYSEDIGYHRFTNLMLKMVQGEQNEQIANLLSGYQSSFQDDKGQTINGYNPQNDIQDLNEVKAPTKMLQKMLKESFLKEYDALLSTKQLARMRDNVQAAGRRIEEFTGSDGSQATRTSFDSHYQKIMQKDDVILRYNAKLYPTLIEFNNILEKSIDKQIEDEKYYMKTPLLVSYQAKKDHKKRIIPLVSKCVTDRNDTYINYYFGKSSEDIQSVEDTSIYRGTFRNLSSIDDTTIQDIQDSSNPSTDIDTDLNLKSIGASYDIFSTQVQGNRGFNIFNSKAEFDFYSGTKTNKVRSQHCTRWILGIKRDRLCTKQERAGEGTCNPLSSDPEDQADCELPGQFAQRNRGGASPINIDSEKLQEGIYHLSGYDYKSARYPIYDIAGSISIDYQEKEANSYLGLDKYGSLTRTQNKYGYERLSNRHVSADGKDFFTINSIANKFTPGNIFYLQKGAEKDCGNEREKYGYKLIDTRYKNTTIKPEQVDGYDYDKFSDQYYLKKYYDYIKSDIDSIYNKIDEKKYEFSGSTNTGITNNILNVKSMFNSLLTGLDQIINFNTSNIGNQTLISSGWISITSGINTQIQSKGSEISSGLINFDNFIAGINTENINYYIQALKYNAQINKENIQFLSGRKQYLNAKFFNTNSLFSSLKNDYLYAKNLYYSINTGELTNKIIDLQSKRNDINSLQLCGIDACGCTNNYSTLCTTINQTILNINSIKNAINDIPTIQEYDSMSGIRNDINTIDSVDQTYSGNLFSSDITSTLATINTFETINDTSNIPKIHFPGMNITTQDRPIDSPRYITFQGLSGSLVKMIYPNLYKTEVYKQSGDILILKTAQEIEISIKDYLKKVIQKYNQDLQNQLNKKSAFYNSKINAFNRLQIIDQLGSPNRSYQLFDEEYLIDSLGEDNIKILAQILYYHNITNQQIKKGNTISEDIQNKIDTFDINQKISHVMSNYLIQDNEQGALITPSYNPQGYEVGFLNSDGQDYIDSKPLPNFIQQIQEAKNKFSKDNENNKITEEKSEFEEQLNTECGINADGTALLIDLSDFSSPRVKAFGCRLKKTLAKPFEINVKFPFEMPNTNGNFGEDLLNFAGTSMRINDLIQAGENLGGQRSSLNPESYNQNVLANTTSDQEAIRLQEMLSYVQTKSEQTSLDMLNNTGILNILSTKDLGNISINIYSTGNDCLFSPGNSNNLCTNKITTKFNPYSDKKTIPIKIKDNKAGSTTITFELCLADTNKCVKKTQLINTLAGEIQQIKIISPDNKIMVGSQMPILVEGLDQYQNNVGQSLKNFYISVSTGEISDGSAKGKTIRFSNFKQSNFIYYSPLSNSGINEIIINITGDRTSISTNKKIDIIKGIPQVKYGTSTVYKISGNSIFTGIVKFDLPSDANYYHFTDNLGIKQIDENKLPKIELEILGPDGKKVNINTFANIKTQNNILRVGNIQARNRTIRTGGGIFDVQQMGFYSQNNIQIQSGKITIFMYPNFKAGSDILTIDIPGIQSIKIPIQIKAGTAKKIKLNIEKTSLKVAESSNGGIQITDIRGNLYTNPINIKIGTIGSISLSGSNSSSKLITIIGGKYNFDINTKEPGGISYIYSSIDGVNINNQDVGYQTITVQKNIIPTEKLNIMYLNLFGTDRGNQRGYFSDNKNFINKLITGSNKLISTTTSLIDPLKLKTIDYTINEIGKINNDSNFETTLKSNKLERIIDVESIGEIYFNNTNFNIIQIQEDEDGLYSEITNHIKNNPNKNIFYYIPENLDKDIKENKVIQNNIIINSKSVLDSLGNIDENISIKLSDKYIQDLNIREIYFGEKLLGSLLIHIGYNKLITGDKISAKIKINNNEYQNTITFGEGSSNGKKGIGFFTQDSNFPEESKGYNSIEDSQDPSLNIGFRGDLKNITLFAGGENVGESTKSFSSEFLINYGDPLVKKISKNKNIDNTNYDGGLGKLIYSDPDKTIFKVKNIDFNGDGLEDFVIAYTDGTIKLLKNYGGKEPYHNLQELTILAEGIKEIYIGDVDGNTYQDIIIHTKSDQIRIYTNQFGIFDVDGYLACLNTNIKQGEKSQTPENLGGVDQIFFEDMNKDNKIDIITNDKKGYIKIFYGGNNNYQGYANYVSKLKYTCDPDRYSRQSVNQNTKIVKRFGIKLDETKKILDNSLIHRDGLEQISPEEQYQDEEDLENAGISIDSSQIENYINNTDPEDIDSDVLMNMAGPNNFDIGGMIGAGAENYLKYVSDPVGIQPIYENLTGEDLVFMPLGFLSGENPISAYKNYEDINGDILENGDLVKVTVTLKANKNFLGTFIDKISGPRDIKMHPDGHIKHFWFKTGTDISNIKMHWKLKNGYSYMLDNLDIKQGDNIQFYYRVNYIAGDNIKISIKDIEGKDYKYKDSNPMSNYILDNYPDISTKPSDGCSRSMTIFFNNKDSSKKNYDEKFVDLQKIMQEYTQEQEQKYQDTMSEITKMISDVDGEEGVSNLVGGDTFETFDVGELLSQSLNGGSTINLGFLDEATAGINEKIDGALNGLCQGFKLGGNSCGGLPIPFNQAFLAPGKYHLFGCYNLAPVNTLLGGGVPMLFFPGTLLTPVGPIPMVGNGFVPIVQKGAGDGFKFSAPGGIYPSMFRLYIAPTLTMQVGIAMCMGPYTLGANIPKPFRDIAGNCIVMSVPIPLPCGNKTNSTTNTQQYPERMNELGNNTNACESSIGPSSTLNGYSPSPFQLVGSSENNPNSTPVIPQNSYAFGFIQIDKDPILSEDESHGLEIEIGGVKLQGGADIKNKIKGGMTKGLKKIIIDNRLDRQIKYIMNNLTQMDITVYLPEISSIFDGMSNEELSEKAEDFKKEKTNIKEKNNNTTIKKKETNKLISKTQLNDLSSNLSNPFDFASSVLGNTKLIKINQKDLNIKIPMIYSEDVNAYSNYLKQWKITNLGEKDENGVLVKSGIIHKRQNLIYGVIGMCALDSKKIAEKQGVKEKYQEVMKQLTGELKKFETEMSTKQELKSNTDYEIIKECEKDLSKMRLLINFAGKISNNSKEQYIEDKKNIITKIIKNCSMYFDDKEGKLIKTIAIIDEEKLEKNLLSNIKDIKEAKKEMEDYMYKNNLKENLGITGDISNMSGDDLTGSKIEQCINAFGENKIDEIIDSFITLNDNSAQLEKAIRENIKTLELYKKFPLELYERFHIQDKYLGEVSSLITDFIGKITYWINTNANRYSQYVDSLITLIGIIKTYQILIDFSVNRSERCGKCSNDTYDSYSCSLSMLCPDVGLPIIPIPPFKIPNIIIDLSNINLGIDILLPKINFTPTKIALLKIPDLPEPPKYSLGMSLDEQGKVGIDLIGDISVSLSLIENFKIPSIPELPKPPQLPEPPEIVPTVDLELPVLPPAPKLPEISTSIKNTIKIAEIAGKILCIIKGGIGLVGEKGVKAKIEQMTQRTYDVPFFDFMDITTKFKDPPLKGFDYEIDSYVNLQFNFDYIYAFLDGLADEINKISKGAENIVEKKVGQLTNELNNNGVTDTFGDIQGGKIFNYNLIDSQEAKKGLVLGLNELKTSSQDEKINKEISNILENLEQDEIKGEIDGIKNIEQEVKSILSEKKKENIKIAENIRSDYDGFISKISKNNSKLASNNEEIEFSSNLFKIPEKTKEILLAQENPIDTYVKTQSKIVDGYLNSLNKNDAKSLNMSEDTYIKSLNYINNLNNKIKTISKQLNKSQITKSDFSTQINKQTKQGKTLISQSNGGTNTSNSNPGGYSDISSFINGVLIQGYSGSEKRMINTVYDSEFISNIRGNYFQQDINKDNKKDIIMRDTNNIYIKYHNQEDDYKNEKTYNDFYSYEDGLVDPQDLVEITNEGYINIGDIRLKVYSPNREVKNFEMGGQTFETIKFSWLNNRYLGDDPDGYLIKINHRIDTFNDKDQIIDSFNKNKINKKYILVIPNGFSYTGVKIRLEEGTYRLESLLTGTISQIIRFNPSNEKINAVLSYLPRNREYAKISTLKFENKILFINSPRSNQTVGGIQIIGDDKGPEATISLYRPMTKKTIGTGENLEGFISTNYILNAIWEDNLAISKMRIEKDNEIIKTITGSNKTGFINITGLFFTGETQEKYTFRAEDFNKNIESVEVKLDIKIPNIEITSIKKLDNPIGNIIQPITISTKIENDLDEGNIIFQRSRYPGLRQNLTGTIAGNEISKFGLYPEKTMITGGYFDFGDTIGLYLSNGIQIAKINPNNGEIQILEEYKNDLKIILDFSSKTPIIKIIDIKKTKILFQIYLAPKQLVGVNANGYEKIKLENKSFGTFTDGRAIKDNGEIILFISPNGHIYTEKDVYGEYYFNKENESVNYKFWTKEKENNKGEINIKTKTLFQ